MILQPTQLAISAAIINYNTREHLCNCLKSPGLEPANEVVVVDNASTDGSVEMVRSCFPRVKLVANRVNVGYGAAANQAVANLTAPYVLILNSDTRIQPGVLNAFVAYLDQNPRVGIVGPSIIGPDGSPQRSCFPFPTPLNVFLQENSLGALFQHQRGFERLPYGNQGKAITVPWVLGAALTVRRAAFEAIGGFDEAYFMYFEEVDLCYRLRCAEWRVDFLPDAIVEHVGAASTKQDRVGMKFNLYMSLIRFYSQHYSRARRQTLNLILAYFMVRNIFLDSIRLFQLATTLHVFESRRISLFRNEYWSSWQAFRRIKPDRFFVAQAMISVSNSYFERHHNSL